MEAMFYEHNKSQEEHNNMALVEVGKRARFAAQQLSGFSSEKRRQILSSVHQALESSREEIEEANRADIEESKGVISDSLLKRLDLCGPKFDHALEGLKELIDRSDPVGVVTLARELDQDLELYRVTCPLGVVCGEDCFIRPLCKMEINEDF